MSRMNARSALAAYIGLVLTNLFWAGNAVIARAVSNDIPPFALSFWRWGLALLIILPFGLPHILRNRELIRANLGRIVLLSLLSVGGYNTLLYVAAHTTTAVNITLVNATIPVLIALMAWLLLRQPTTLLQLLGIGAALSGILVIISRGDLSLLAGLDFHRGDLIMVGAVTIWALYSVLLRRHSEVLRPINLVGFLTLTIIAAMPLILGLYLWESASGKPFLPDLSTMPTLLTLAIFPGIMAYGLWNFGVTVLGPSRTGIFIYLMPLFAAILAYIFLDERLAAFHAVGGALILVGLFMASRSRRR